MKTVIQNKYQDFKLDNIEEFYNEVVKGMDLYFMKVLFCRVIHVVSSALISYRSFTIDIDNNKNEASKQEEINSYHHAFTGITYQIEMFSSNMKLYLNEIAMTINEKTMRDMYNIMSLMRTNYLHHLSSDDDPKQSLYNITYHLKDKRFNRDFNGYVFDTETVIDCQQLFYEIKQINVHLNHMIEAKNF